MQVTTLATDVIVWLQNERSGTYNPTFQEHPNCTLHLHPHDHISVARLSVEQLIDQPNLQAQNHAFENMTFEGNKNSGATGAVTAVTSTVGNGVGGVTRTVGGVVGAAGRGVGGTVTGVTGQYGKPVGDALNSLGTGIEGGAADIAKGVEKAGQGKKVW